jgi:perosamine synthetase
MRTFRNHGITTDHRQRAKQASWFYEMVALGYNYRISDFQCALALSQLNKLPGWVRRRQEIARRYDQAFEGWEKVQLLAVRPGVAHAYHLYVVRLKQGTECRSRVFSALREAGVGVNVHYIPVHLHPFYRERFATGPGLCPVAEAAYEKILTLPIFPAMSNDDVDYVVETLHTILQ